MTNRELAGVIIDKFEELLDKYDIKLPSDEREGNEDEAAIYGIDYFDLEDEITTILDKQASLKNIRYNIKNNSNINFCNNHSFEEIKNKNIDGLDYEKAHDLLYAENRSAHISVYLGVYDDKFQLTYSVHGTKEFDNNYQNVLSEEIDLDKIKDEKELKNIVIDKLDKFFIDTNKLIYTLSIDLDKENNVEQEESEEL